MAEDEHRAPLPTIQQCRGKVMLSGYLPTTQILRHCGLWEGPLCMLVSARASPGRPPESPRRAMRLETGARSNVHGGRVGPVRYASVARAAVGGRPGISVRLTSDQRTQSAGFLLTVLFRRQPSGALTVRAKITAFSRVRRDKRLHSGGTRGICPSKVSTAARPVPQNPSGHPHSPSPTMIAVSNVRKYGKARRQTPRTRGR
jgi:hypothetical protein